MSQAEQRMIAISAIVTAFSSVMMLLVFLSLILWSDKHTSATTKFWDQQAEMATTLQHLLCAVDSEHSSCGD